MNRIFIKTFFNGTKEVSKAQAKKWAQCLLNGATSRAGAIEVIQKRLLGIALGDLLNK